MKFYSTNNKTKKVNLKEAVVKGLAQDNGLYMPETIPSLQENIIEALPDMSLQEIAFALAYPYLNADIPSEDLRQLIDDAINFDVPVVEVENRIYSAELYEGPTLAFKDFGARFMARLLGYFTQNSNEEINVLVATSGDTGSAVANGFLGVKGIKVFVLYPSGLVSPIQESQFTTLGQNITALEVNGTFDDCQAMVKAAFLDPELNAAIKLTSANSINIARLIPQMFYYAYAYSLLADENRPVVACVPSGNFGNLTAGLIAKRMGVPISRFVAATNVNDIVPQYLDTAVFTPRPSIATISNAMDVGNPSNFARILDLYDHNHEAITGDIVGFSYTDDQVRTTLGEVYNRTGYLMDPHGTVGYLALKKYFETDDQSVGFFLETAHPAKFADTVKGITGQEVEIPARLQKFIDGKKQSVKIDNHFAALKNFLLGK